MKRFILSQLFFLTICSGTLPLCAQVNSEIPERSIITIQRGVKFHDEEKYDEAIAEYKKIHRNDSNYYLASVELLNTYLTQEKNEEGIVLCDHLLKLKNDYTPNILIYKGDFLDNLKKYEEAEKVYEDGARDYPLNYSFYYEKAISKLKQKKYDEAYALLIKTVRINPFHAASHQRLGLLAYQNNNITATMLAFQFYLICDPNSKRAQNLVGDLEKIARLELETDSAISLKAFENENDFTELESIVKSKVALGDKYKSKIDLKFDLVKQMQLVIENISKYPEVKGFFNDFYGKFFSELQKNKFFEPYVYHALKGMEIESVNKWISKNSSEMDKFELWAYNHMCTQLANYPENISDKMVSVPHWFNNNNIAAAGEKNEQGKNTGYWTYYYKNGIKKSEGEFLNGDKVKVWKYYSKSGGIEEEVQYLNGAEKLYKSFYKNNNPHVEVDIENNKMHGLRKVYFSNGNIASSTEYKEGVINGTQTYYFKNGSQNYTIKNVDGSISGALVEYFDNGKIYQQVNFVNNNREGLSKIFWNNAGNTVESEGNYIKNKPTGDWKEFYRSGKVSKEKHYNDDGMLDGGLKEFYENGKVKTDELYSNGKINGLSVEYSDDGKLWQEFLYKKGKLLEYRAYKKDGTKICDNKINGKNFALTLFHPNGTKRREGKVSEGELDGIWKDYSLFGVLLREINYKDGKQEGKDITYYPNGKIQRERYYVNDVENGNYRSFYINGQTETEGLIVNGNNEGYWKTYYIDGSLESKIYYSDNEIDGWNEYYDVNGKLASEDLYSENCLIKIVFHDTSGKVLQNIDLPGGNGLLEKKTMDGKTIFKKQYLKSFPEGFSRSFYPDGKVETEVEYKKGKREGKSLGYNALGALLSNVPYFNNKKNGKEIVYYEDGKIRSEYNYDNGDYHSHCYSYFENGKIFKDVHYDYGEAEGESNVYDDAGELLYTRVFHNDLLVSYSYKNGKGELLSPMELEKGDIKVSCYFQNGKKSFEANYTNGDLNGKRVLFYSNGKIMDEADFYFDYQNGSSKEYYSSGILKVSENYVYGKQEGKAESYFENGKLKVEENYHKGTEHGWFKYYDNTGKLLKSILYYNGDPILVK